MAPSSNKLLYRDGTGQAQRLPAPLDPGYVSADERSLADWIRFARACAKELVFFDAENNPSGTWEGFLSDGAGGGGDAFIAGIVGYIDNPGKLAADKNMMQQFSKPHLSLFITFLQLLGHIKSQLNGFTKKHLDFYYLNILGLDKKKPLPDMVNVMVELAGEVSNLLLEKGTAFLAGKDALNKDLLYTTTRDTVASRAAIQNIKTLFVDKRTTGIQEARKNNRSDPDKGFMKMMQLALGDPGPGDELPGKVVITGNTRLSDDYINNSLFLSLADFAFLQGLALAPGEVADAVWSTAYGKLENAYKEKMKRGRQNKLKSIREYGILQKDQDKGLARMFEFALGDPEAQDPLQVYKNAASGTLGTDLLTMVFNHLTGKNESYRRDALEYITNELLLKESEFKMIMDIFQNDPGKDWSLVYATLEVAQQQKRKITSQPPYKEEWLNVFAVNDARAAAFSMGNLQDKNSLRFNTFGKSHPGEVPEGVEYASIGFAVASPTLLLQEGNRKITLTISFQDSPEVDFGKLKTVLSGLNADDPFWFYLSNGTPPWTKIAAQPAGPLFGNFAVNNSGEVYQATLSPDKAKVTRQGYAYNTGHVGKCIVWNDGKAYLITGIDRDNASATVAPLDNIVPPGMATGVMTCSLYKNALQFRLAFDETAAAADASLPAGGWMNIGSEGPVLAMVLHQPGMPFAYQQFKDLRLKKVHVAVQADNLRALALQNDNSVLDYKKPFEPFGLLPETGSSLYFAHPELSGKRLDTLSLGFEWMNAPAKFEAYYTDYARVSAAAEDGSAEKALTDKQYIIKGNSDFTAGVQCITDGRARTVKSINLFDATISAAPHTETVPLDIPAAGPPLQDEEAMKWSRYFSVTLDSKDFQHHAYTELLTRQAMFFPVKNAAGDYTAHWVRKIILKPPYTPKLKSLTAGYTASFEIDITAGIAGKEDRIFHIAPFGYQQVRVPGEPPYPDNAYFLPHFIHEGELYIGLSELRVPQSVPLLFQMAEGSADPDQEAMPVAWSCLAGNEWQKISGTSLVSDTTNNLTSTGIIEFDIPETATSHNTLMNDGLHWIRAGIAGNADAIPDTIGIFANGINLVFAGNGNAADHLQALLPPQTIRETENRIPEIKKIIQPYTSFKGSPAETDPLFYRRVSERLRHKNRAVTVWDYERIVLEQFPGIYKVKCVSGSYAGGAGNGVVELIVIPDIRGKLPFNPFQPKVPQDTLHDIRQYLEQRMPAWATVKVKNPSYVQVRTQFAVKIKDGYNKDFFLAKLEGELIKFLAPWAYDEGADIYLDRRMDADMIVNFVAERPYVEYLAGMKLYQGTDGKNFTAVIPVNGENFVQAERPDVILVSATSHDIHLIQKTFRENDYKGIGYMKIEFDFTVG